MAIGHQGMGGDPYDYSGREAMTGIIMLPD